jgi:uncharacterized protein
MSVIMQPYLSKDFIETAEGLCFAIVQSGVERYGQNEKVLCFLRYIRLDNNVNNCWQKVNSDAANAYLKHYFPQYLHHSDILDADMHGVEIGDIARHFKPRERLQQIMASIQRDQVEQDLFDLCFLFQQNGLDLSQIGVTGSVLIGVHQSASDIDLVFYEREHFQKARTIVADLIEHKKLSVLGERDWHESYARRACELRLEDYVWHERRKFNKALINSRKFDLNLIVKPVIASNLQFNKCGALVIKCKITDDRYSFDYPAIYEIDHEEIGTVVCFIATFTGQAVDGETVEISGLLEQADDGGKRIVVGSSREAPGEYIKVIA